MDIGFTQEFVTAINEWGGARNVEAIYLVGCPEYYDDIVTIMQTLLPKGKLQPLNGGPFVYNHPNMREEFDHRFNEGGTYHAYSWRENLPPFLQNCTRGLFVKLYNGAVLKYQLPKLTEG